MNMCLCAGQGSRVPEASTVGSVSAASQMDRTQPGSQREWTGPKSHSKAGRCLTPAPEFQHGERTHPSSVTKGIKIFTTYNILNAL